MSPEKAGMLLKDLARWTFGEVLARQASYHAVEAGALSAEVRAFRYGILCCALKDDVLRGRALAEPIVAAPWELMLDWADFGSARDFNETAEIELATRFISRMENFGAPTDALRRFARGKAFKYGRRVLMLAEKAP